METELVNVNEGVAEVLRIPGDGNCLFSALAHPIWKCDPRTSLGRMYQGTLRTAAVQFYRNRMNDWMEQLYAHAIVALPQKADNIPPAELVNNFLSCLSKSGFLGGEESLLAIVTNTVRADKWWSGPTTIFLKYSQET